MDPVTGGLIASGVGGIASFFGQRSANKAMLEDAKRNRQFQEKMSSTAWQRAVTDMEAAGINPALAYSRGGASTPGGSAASGLGNALGSGVSSALQAKMQHEQYKLIRNQADAAKAEALKTQSEHQIVEIDRAFKNAEMGFYFDGTGRVRQSMIDLMEQQHAGKLASSARDVTELNLAKLREPELRAIAQIFNRVGEGGKAAQIAAPVLLRLLRR